MSSGSDELSPAARALLDNARAAAGPDAAAIARMRSKIDATVGGGAATGATLATKLAVVGVVAAVAIGAVGYREASRPAASTIEDRVEQTRRAVDAAPELETPVLAVEPAPRVHQEEIEMAPASARAPDAKRAPATVKAVDLAREVELVDRAMAAMKRGDAALALEAVHLHVRETGGKGQLAEDAAAIEIEAMCRSGKPVADKLAAFDVRWPTSAQRSRLSSACPRSLQAGG